MPDLEISIQASFEPSSMIGMEILVSEKIGDLEEMADRAHLTTTQPPQ
jgi:hypothetical protein